jgi:hypothetical protein
MKKLSFSAAAAAAAFLTVAGCSASNADVVESDATSAAQSSTPWQNVLTCDRGAAVLDTDANERRHLQFVIRNPQVIGYIASQVRVSTQGILSPSGEIIIDGHQDSGVWAPADFHAMNGGVPYVNVDVHREDAGIRVSFWVNAQGSQGCFCRSGGDPCGGSLCQCPGGPDDLVCPGDPHAELANWYFQSCG